MTDTGVAPIARPAEPIEYGTRSSPRVGPPLIVPAIAVTSLIIAVMTIAVCVWTAARSYYTAPPRTSPPPPRQSVELDETPVLSKRRVTLEEGNALLDGIGKVVPLSDEQRKMLSRVLVGAEDRVAVDLGPDPTPEKIAATVVKSGKLFGEDGSYIDFRHVHVEVSNRRARIAGEPGDQPLIEYQANGASTTSGGYPQVWSFRPPPPPPRAVPTPPAPPPPPTLREQLNDLAPRLPFYADAIVSTLLAVLLLVAAVGLLNYRRLGRTLHFVWAWVKLPLALGAAAAYFWLTMNATLQLPRGATPWTHFVLLRLPFLASLLVALYAIAVLVLLSLPHVRRYFRRDYSPARSE
jgi:hypothetical protein